MIERNFAALDAHQLLPRALTEVREAALGTHHLGRSLTHPMVLRGKRALPFPTPGLALLDAAAAEAAANKQPLELTVAHLEAVGMAELIRAALSLAEVGVAGVALDLGGLSATPPYGEREWRPRTREEIAELRAAAGRPLWVMGLLSAADAEVAAEAGADGVVLSAELGWHLGAPSVIEVLPEVIDAVGGTLTVIAGGPVRSGIDVFRYLAVGAELVVVDGERPLATLMAELDYAMRLTGCSDLTDVGYHALFAPLFGEP